MRRWYEPKKDTPGIDKNAPKKKGLARYLETLWREFFPLLKLNLLFLLSCVPIITIPAAMTAMSRITVAMVRDRNYFMWADYWDAFKRDFGRSLLAGILLAAAIGMFGLSTWFYYMLAQANSKFFLVLSGVSLCLLLTALSASMYFFPMLAMVELPTRKLLLNSCIMTYSCFRKTVPALLVSAVLLIASVGLFPFSLITLVFVTFSLTSLTSNFFLVKPILVVVLGQEESAHVTEDIQTPEDTSQVQLSSAELGEFPEWEDEKGEE